MDNKDLKESEISATTNDTEINDSVDDKIDLDEVKALIDRNEFTKAREMLDQFMDLQIEDPDIIRQCVELIDTINLRRARSLLSDAEKLIDEKKYKLAYRSVELAGQLAGDNEEITKGCRLCFKKMETISQTAVSRAKEKINKNDIQGAVKFLTYAKNNFINSNELASEIDALLDSLKEKQESENGDGQGTDTEGSGKEALGNASLTETVSKTDDNAEGAYPAEGKRRFKVSKKIIIPAAVVILFLGTVYYVYSPSHVDLRKQLFAFIRGNSTEDISGTGASAGLTKQGGDVLPGGGRDPSAQEGSYGGNTPQKQEGSAQGTAEGRREEGSASGSDNAGQAAYEDTGEGIENAESAERENTPSDRTQGGPARYSRTDVAAVADESNLESTTPVDAPITPPPSEDTDAMVLKGDQAKNGNGGEPDYELALEWYQRAAERGNPTAQDLYNETLSYMSLRMDDGTTATPAVQKSKIAAYTGISENRLHFLETAIITDGREGSLFDCYDANGNMLREKMVLMSDGSIQGYYIDEGRLFSAEGYFR